MPEPQSGALTTSPQSPYVLAGAVGIEPTPEVLETSVLPLNYAPIMVEGDGFEPPNPEGADLQSAAFSHFATPPKCYRWCRLQDLNPQPTDYKSVALPIELSRHTFSFKLNIFIKLSQLLMVARDGIEPPTQGFSVLCSTD
jgi:hypothetical protein